MPKLTREQKEMNAQRVDRIADRVWPQYKKRICDTTPDFVTDLLADLMHFAHAQGIDFDNQLRIARDHFYCEQNGVD
jgi:hypothetical protein